jgi:hypothetical protein
MSSFCQGCGNGMSEGERFCGVCGKDALAGSAAPVDPGIAFGLPPETSGWAIFSFVCGVLFIILPLSIVAVIFGHLSLSEIRRSAGRLKGKGLAITGLVLGYVGVAAIVGLIIVGIVAQHPTQKAATEKLTVMSNENSVVASVRSLNTAEIAYAQAHREAGYTCSLSDLSGAWGISGELASGRKNGYVFELHDCSATKTNGPVVKYQLVAYPAEVKKSGTPAFCSSESDVIKVARNGSVQECLQKGADLSESEINHPQN